MVLVPAIIATAAAFSIGSRLYHRDLYSKASEFLDGRKDFFACLGEMSKEGYTTPNTTVPLTLKLTGDCVLLSAASVHIAPLLYGLPKYFCPIINAVRAGISDPHLVFSLLWEWLQWLKNVGLQAIAGDVIFRVNQLYRIFTQKEENPDWSKIWPLVYQAIREDGQKVAQLLWSLLDWVFFFFVDLIKSLYAGVYAAVQYVVMDLIVLMMEIGFIASQTYHNGIQDGTIAQRWVSQSL